MSKPIQLSDEQFNTVADIAATLGESPDRLIADLLEHILKDGRLLAMGRSGIEVETNSASQGAAALEALAQSRDFPAVIILDAHRAVELDAEALRTLYRLTHTIYESDDDLLRALGADDEELAELEQQADVDADL